MSGIRTIALAIFTSPDRFLNPECLSDFRIAGAIVRDIIEAPANAQVAKHAEEHGACAFRKLSALSSWPEFFDALCGHELFSGKTSEPFDFVEIWNRINGFDIDGLLEIGDPSAESTRSKSEYVAKHDLGRVALDSWLRDLDDLADQHVHFGQQVDWNLIWLTMLRSLRPPLDSHFGTTQRALRFGEFERTQRLEDIQGTVQRKDFSQRLAKCRILLSCFDSDALPYDVIKHFFESHVTEQGIRDLEDLTKSAHEELAARDIQYLIRAERRLLLRFRRLEDDEGSLVHKQLSIAYIILKNSVFNLLLSNSVGNFFQFTRSLRILDYVYMLAKSDLGNVNILRAFHSHLVRSSSIPADVRITMRPAHFRDQSFRSRLRDYINTLETTSGSNTPVVLAAHRDDFERSGSGDWMRIAESILDDHLGWGITIVGFDLIGPEVRTTSVGQDRQLGGTSPSYILDSIDFIFDIRNKVEEGAKSRQMFTTFHCGEYSENDRVGVLGMLAVLADNRFRTELDRISHGLVLHTDSATEPGGRQSTGVIDSIIGRLLNRSRCWSNGLFDDAEVEEIIGLLQAYQAAPDSTPLGRLSEIMKKKFTDGTVNIEVCPFSNEMIRGNDLGIKADNHCWSELYGQRNLFLGTDDPSLTQTLPWMEHTFLRAAAARSGGEPEAG